MSTDVIRLEPTLMAHLDEVAAQSNIQVGDLVNQAVSRFLDELNRRKIRAEGEAFRRMHAMLLDRYRGEYVAVHHGQVVDHDPQVRELSRRIRARFGKTPVLIQQVTDEPHRLVAMRSPWHLEPNIP